MRILLAGAGGIVGSGLLGHLLREGADVIALCRRREPRLPEPAEGAGRCVLVRGDLTEGLDLDARADIIVHAAALLRPGDLPVADYVQANLRMTRHILDYASRTGGGPIVFLSSLCVYGEIRSPVVDEDTGRVNPTPYGISKILSERMLQEAAGRVASLSLRLPGVLAQGAREIWLAKVREKARAGETIEIYNPESPFNNAVHVRDLARFIVALGERGLEGAGAVTLGCAEAMPVGEVVRTVIEACRSSSSIVVRPAEVPSFTISSERAIARYGYRPSPLRTILREFLEEAEGGDPIACGACSGGTTQR